MTNVTDVLAAAAPRTLRDALAHWPERAAYTPSPRDWRDEVFYFLLPDRFSDGSETELRRLGADLSTPAGLARIQALRGPNFRWDRWRDSGEGRFQGGTLRGIHSKLDYLRGLGVTTLWIGPVFRQRVEEDTYHGYGIQDFLEVDPRFGTRADLVELVDAAHAKGLRVVLDVIFNHSGCNFLYDGSAGDGFEPPYRATGGYSPIWPRSGLGGAITASTQPLGPDDYVHPQELQGEACYLRAGSGNLGAGDILDPHAEHKRTDFFRLRKFDLFADATLGALILSYHYWIALLDLDGFRIDTFKHVTLEQARNFCNAIKEYAEVLGKEDFFLVAEIAGGDEPQQIYLEISGRNLNACLDIGAQREAICSTGKGLSPAATFFDGFKYTDRRMGTHRNWGSQHLSISDDHDHVFGRKLRLGADAANSHQAAAAVALQLFTLGIPCLYYGTEQGLASGVEPEQRRFLPNWGQHDAFLREAMFGPDHPRAAGFAGTQGARDGSLPGFGPHGTSGWHVFDPSHPIYTRITAMAETRRLFKPLRRGRQYPRDIAFLDRGFTPSPAGELVAWSRIFDDQEVLVVLNPHGREARGARIVVDGRLAADGMQVVLNTDPSAAVGLRRGAFVASELSESRRILRLDQSLLGPSEVLVMANRTAVEGAGLAWQGR